MTSTQITIQIWLGCAGVVVGMLIGSVMVVVLAMGLLILTRLEDLR